MVITEIDADFMCVCNLIAISIQYHVFQIDCFTEFAGKISVWMCLRVDMCVCVCAFAMLSNIHRWRWTGNSVQIRCDMK